MKSILFFKISVISDCTLSRLGDLPFYFGDGTCENFILNPFSSIFMCFDYQARRKCIILKRRKNNILNNANVFVFDNEFYLDKNLPETNYDHHGSTIANYQGYPLVLGGMGNSSLTAHTKLEMLQPNKNAWIEGAAYPYAKR